MKSAFGSKRKARVIRTEDEEEAGTPDVPKESPAPAIIKAVSAPGFGTQKPNRMSSLRQSMAVNDDSLDIQQNQQPPLPDEAAPPLPDEAVPEESVTKPYESVSRPVVVRSISTKLKKRGSSSCLSFGLGEIISGDAAEALEDNEAFTPKKHSLGRRITEANAARQIASGYNPAVRGGEDEDGRPTYSKDYLNELKNSTPTMPGNSSDAFITIEDEIPGLDPSELEGALIVPSDIPRRAHIPSESEVREKKERRARLAKEADYISLSKNDDNASQKISLLPSKKKSETRLVREDEDLAEGFDDFVQDGHVALGRKAERTARRKQRSEMATLIQEAEASASDDSDDSEAERRAAYDDTQTRAGMEGLRQGEQNGARSSNGHGNGVHAPHPPKIMPLPNLTECLQRLQSSLGEKQMELARRRKRLEELRVEKNEILGREEEVQRLLTEAGQRYTALSGGSVAPGTARGKVDVKAFIEGRTMGIGGMPAFVEARGLESIGNTPQATTAVEDVG